MSESNSDYSDSNNKCNENTTRRGGSNTGRGGRGQERDQGGSRIDKKSHGRNGSSSYTSHNNRKKGQIEALGKRFLIYPNKSNSR